MQPAQPQQGFSLRRFFGVQDTPPPVVQAPVVRPRRTAPPAAAVAKQEKPKVDPSTHVVVFGDSLAGFARQGLDAHFAENQDVEVVAKVRGDVSLVRADPADWPNFVKATLDGGQKTSVAVVMLGTSDRQSIREGDETIEPLSDRWKDLYRKRVDAIATRLQGARDPRGLDRPAADEEQQDLRRPRRHERDLQGERPAQRRRLCGYLAGLRRR